MKENGRRVAEKGYLVAKQEKTQMNEQNEQLHPDHRNRKVILASQRATNEACNPKPSMLETLQTLGGPEAPPNDGDYSYH